MIFFSCCPRHSFSVGTRTLIMGILNLSPESFSGDGVADRDEAVRKAFQLVEDGADVLDIGGESTRPGSVRLSLEEEIVRVLPVLEELIRRDLPIPISVDTYKPAVAREALKRGACIINDIFGLRQPGMVEAIADADGAVVIMHMQGTPQTMQINPQYRDCPAEIAQFLRDQIAFALSSGIKREKIIVDPGIGFGKTVEHNLQILNRLRELKELGFPVLIGPSRKSFIGRILHMNDPAQRVWGTASAVAVAIANGADIVRVHDVRQMRDVVRIADAIVRSSAY